MRLYTCPFLEPSISQQHIAHFERSCSLCTLIAQTIICVTCTRPTTLLISPRLRFLRERIGFATPPRTRSAYAVCVQFSCNYVYRYNEATSAAHRTRVADFHLSPTKEHYLFIFEHFRNWSINAESVRGKIGISRGRATMAPIHTPEK
jgi:hypothetical protein